MFNKNNNDKIETLINTSNKTVEVIGNLRELVGSMQDNMLKMALVQNQHKDVISFLMTHATVGEDAQEDFEKLLEGFLQTEKDIKKEIKRINEK